MEKVLLLLLKKRQNLQKCCCPTYFHMSSVRLFSAFLDDDMSFHAYLTIDVGAVITEVQYCYVRK